jgi:hypothetical protein
MLNEAVNEEIHTIDEKLIDFLQVFRCFIL